MGIADVVAGLNQRHLECGDCLEVMPSIPDSCIDLVLCDLPYGTTQSKWDIIIPFEPLWAQYRRVIKPTGALVFTAAAPFSYMLGVSNLEWFRCEWVWDKRSPTGHLNVKKRPMLVHENVLVFAPGQEVYNPQLRTDVTKPFGKVGLSVSDVYGRAGTDIQYGVGYPLSIIPFPRPNNLSGGGLHPNQKPLELMEYLVRTYSNAGDLVLDNAMGSGTTGEACIRMDRRFIGIEKGRAYFETACTRLDTAQHPLPRVVA